MRIPDKMGTMVIALRAVENKEGLIHRDPHRPYNRVYPWRVRSYLVYTTAFKAVRYTMRVRRGKGTLLKSQTDVSFSRDRRAIISARYWRQLLAFTVTQTGLVLKLTGFGP